MKDISLVAEALVKLGSSDTKNVVVICGTVLALAAMQLFKK